MAILGWINAPEEEASIVEPVVVVQPAAAVQLVTADVVEVAPVDVGQDVVPNAVSENSVEEEITSSSSEDSGDGAVNGKQTFTNSSDEKSSGFSSN